MSASVREAAQALVDKLVQVHADPAFQAVWTGHEMRSGPYAGPAYGAEWDALIAALDAPASPVGEVERLREALKPFVAHWQPWMDDDHYHPDYDEMSCFARATYGDLRRARAALSTPAQSGEGETDWRWWAGLDEEEYRLAGPCLTRADALCEAYGATQPGDTIYLVEAIAETEHDGGGIYAFVETRNRSHVIRKDDLAPDTSKVGAVDVREAETIIAMHWPSGCWYQPDGTYAGSTESGHSYQGDRHVDAVAAWARQLAAALSASPPPVEAGMVTRPDDSALDAHLPERIGPEKRCGIQRSAWMTAWFVPWSPRNDNENAEGPWSHWVALAHAILAADEKAQAAMLSAAPKEEGR